MGEEAIYTGGYYVCRQQEQQLLHSMKMAPGISGRLSMQKYVLACSPVLAYSYIIIICVYIIPILS